MSEHTQNQKLIEMVRAGFELAWKISSSSIEISRPQIRNDGIDYRAELYDPFSGSIVGRYRFSWDEIEEVMKDPHDVSWIHEGVSEEISSESEVSGGGELVVDNDGRVHFRSDIEDQ